VLTGAIASYVGNEPCPVLVLLPTESDARDYMVSDIEPIFAATPALRGSLSADAEEGNYGAVHSIDSKPLVQESR